MNGLKIYFRFRGLLPGSWHWDTISRLLHFLRDKVNELSVLIFQKLIPLPNPDVLRKMEPNLSKIVHMELDVHSDQVLLVHCLQVVANFVAKHERIGCGRTSEQSLFTGVFEQALIVVAQRPCVTELRKATRRVSAFERSQNARIVLGNLRAGFEFRGFRQSFVCVWRKGVGLEIEANLLA
jgi:hypothetical protein